jgi:hypothetical protein
MTASTYGAGLLPDSSWDLLLNTSSDIGEPVTFQAVTHWISGVVP